MSREQWVIWSINWQSIVRGIPRMCSEDRPRVSTAVTRGARTGPECFRLVCMTKYINADNMNKSLRPRVAYRATQLGTGHVCGHSLRASGGVDGSFRNLACSLL
ncbi:hypothetical protein DPEC_G00051530 [Dallia pectoralis]|uniref:Uncharacterized protein n=1 Tax=Dallia pectoralis TaxID=75939 RepID=A0ACC2HC02_DALPE|nr:hypothetical protein DPEC_G00051530 [Dallia pectoralis]